VTGANLDCRTRLDSNREKIARVQERRIVGDLPNAGRQPEARIDHVIGSPGNQSERVLLVRLGLVVLGYMWCHIAAAAQRQLADDSSGRMNAKLVTARFFMERMLPETAAHLARIQAGAGSVMELPAEAF